MKKIYSLLAIAALGWITLSSSYDDDNGKAGYTGAPGEQTCNTSGCHTGSALNSQGGTLEISAPGLTNWEYVPGQQYTISVTVGQSGRSLFGLCFEALQSNGDNAGTLAAGAGSHILTKMVSGFNRKSVTHLLNGGASANSHTFTFTWTAPATNIGNVTFYCAGNAANGNGSDSGDFIYTTSQVVTPSSVTSVEEVAATAAIEVFPNPFTNEIRMNYSLPKSGFLSAEVYDLTGKLVANLMNKNVFAGDYSETFDLSELSSGNYFIHLSLNGEVLITKHIQK